MDWFKNLTGSPRLLPGFGLLTGAEETPETRTQQLGLKVRIACVIGLGGLAIAVAQNAELSAISTDRPSVGFSPDSVSGGSFQLENGAGLSHQRGRYVAELLENLVRLGLTERVKLGFLTSNALYQSSRPAGAPFFQPADVALATKLPVTGPNSPAPKSAVLSLMMPTGSGSFTSGSYDPGLTAIWTQRVRQDIS
jgi:hypothetical protein